MSFKEENRYVKKESLKNKCYEKITLPNYESEYYGQHFEDIIIIGLLRTIYGSHFKLSNVNYIEIGAHHPISGSNTYIFYKNGSSGALIEPNEDFYSIIKSTRPRDLLIEKAVVVDPKITTRMFYKVDKTELCTLNKKFIDDWNTLRSNTPKEAKILSRKKVHTLHINQALEESFKDKKIDLLSIDIEGGELEVIKSIEFNKYKPHIICLEWNCNINGCKEDIISSMKKLGYVFCSDTVVNGIFMDINLLK